MKKTILLLLVINIISFLQLRVIIGQNVSEDSIYNIVPKMPHYQGEEKEIDAYLIKHMKYPLEAYRRDVRDTVNVGFIVEKDGSLSDIQIVKPVGFGCDEEAISLVTQMKGWVPGELDGKKVRVRYNLSVPFNEKYYQASQIYVRPDTLPEFPGGVEALIQYLHKETHMPEKANENNISDKVIVHFVIEKDGSVSNVIVMDSLGYGCDEEAVRVISQMPEWSPGINDNVPVRTVLSLDLDFVSVDEDKGEIYVIVEQMPEFPGGTEALMKYFAENVQYPAEAKDKGIQGSVIVHFILDEYGNVTNAKVLKGIGGGCNEEALRVINEMPKWLPGMQKGKRVRIAKNLSVKFTLVQSSSSGKNSRKKRKKG
jgi:TonB family protein